MASITKKNNKYRVRYRLYFPNNTFKDRSRKINKMGLAREVKALADILETKTKLQNYDEKDVNRWWRETLINNKDKELLHIFPDGRKTVRQAAAEYRKTWDVSQKESEARECRISHIIEYLGEDTPINKLRHSDGEYLKKFLRGRGYKVVTINKHLQDLKRMFSLQVAERSIDFHPFSEVKGMKVPQQEKIKFTIPTEQEIQNILEKAEENDQKKRSLLNGNLTLFLLFFFGCGLRLSEAMAARIENIDWEQRGLLLTETKTDKPRTVGLGKKLYNRLLPIKGQKGFILPRFRSDSVSKAILKHFRRCGIKMRLHDARHTYVTLLQEKNVSPIDAMGRSGHTDMQMLSHYSHPKLGIIHEDLFEFMQEDKKE